MAFNVNFLGHIPYNPDELPERNFLTGDGTERPLGFSLAEIARLYWTVRSFNVNIRSLTIGGNDPLTQFLNAGGSSGGIIGANAGLASINSGGAGGDPILRGYTKIRNIYRKKIRVEREGVINGITQKSIVIDKSVSPNMLTSSIINVNEGTLSSAGPIHTYTGVYGYVQIDMSNIIFAKRFYWPKIIILLQSSSISFSSKLSGVFNVSVSGGVNFANLGSINLYGYSASGPLSFASISGGVSIGNRCCDRFFWDGKDDSRFSASDCKKDCESTVSNISPTFRGRAI